MAGASVRPQPWQRSGWSRGSNFKADGQPGEVRRVQMQERERGRPVSCAGEMLQLFFGRAKKAAFFVWCLIIKSTSLAAVKGRKRRAPTQRLRRYK